MVAKKTQTQTKPKVPKVEVESELPTHTPEPEAEPVKPPEAPAPAPVPEAPAPPEKPPAIEEKVDKEKLLSFLEELLDTLTFKRVVLIALLTIIGLGLYALFENRTEIVTKLIEPKTQPTSAGQIPWQLSDSSKTSLQNFAKTTEVAFIAVTDVDLQKNRKVVRWYYVDDPVNLKIEPPALQALALPQAVFDYDPKNTAQMVSILSNEFRCDAYRDTIYFRYAPELADKLPLICRIAVPPFVGQFVGFLTVGITRNMSRLELDTIRLETSRIAVDIYLNDVIKKPAGSP